MTGAAPPGAGRDLLALHLARVPAFRALVRSIECRLVTGLGPLPEPVLDLGCGDGLFAALAFDAPLGLGLDPDVASLAEARGERAHARLVAAGGERLPLRDASLGTVLANSALEHVVPLEETLGEVRRVLRPGGLLVVTAPSDAFAELLLGPSLLSSLGLTRAARAWGRWFNRRSRHFTTDGLPVWGARLERHGFAVERTATYVSPSAARAFEALHYLGVPRLVLRRLTGRWVLTGRSWANPVYRCWLRRHVEEGLPERGAYVMLAARRT